VTALKEERCAFYGAPQTLSRAAAPRACGVAEGRAADTREQKFYTWVTKILAWGVVVPILAPFREEQSGEAAFRPPLSS